jgi:transcriptional regulator with XRE-family HTH domain
MSMPTDSPDRHYLREWREKRGLLQDQLAKMVGSSASVISRFETGERGMKIEMQFKLAAALRIKVWQLFFRSRREPNRSSVGARVARAARLNCQIGEAGGRLNLSTSPQIFFSGASFSD